VPPAVRDEILTTDLLFPRRRYGYAELYRVLEACRLLPVVEPSSVEQRFGRGEAEALALAREHGWWLLINDYQPLVQADSSGIFTVSVPAFVQTLYETGLISLASAEQKLTIVGPVTSGAILMPAEAEIRRLARQRRER
jgi:hypothetical protein